MEELIKMQEKISKLHREIDELHGKNLSYYMEIHDLKKKIEKLEKEKKDLSL